MQRLIIKQPPTLNEMLNKARSNKFRAASDKKKWTNFVAKNALLQLEPIESDRIWVIITFSYCTTASDPDNLFGASKYLMDGLVKAEIIKNDTVKVIQHPIMFNYVKVKTKGEKTVTLRLFDDIFEWKEYSHKLIKEVN